MTYAVKKNAEGIEMIDIVKSLRRIAEEGYRFAGDAADEIERLRSRLEAAESSVAWHQRRWMALQMHQTKMREPERTIVCDILANGGLMHPTVAGDRYSVKEESK